MAISPCYLGPRRYRSIKGKGYGEPCSLQDLDGSRLLQSFDRMPARKGYSNRSEAIRDLIRDKLVDATWAKEDEEVVGTITLVYDHKTHELNDRLIDLQHEFHKGVISSLHVHLDPHNCLEVLIVRGKGRRVQRFADRIIAIKGVKHGKLITTTTGKGIF